MNVFTHRLHRLAAAAVLAIAACGSAAAAGTLVVAPASTNAIAGDSFSVEIRGAGFTDRVVGGGFNLMFDAGVLALTAVAVNTALWEFAPSGGSVDNVAGLLSDVSFNTFASNQPTGDFLAATLTFSAMAPGNATLQLMASGTFPFASHLGDPIAVSFGSGSVAVSPVPEPATWAAMALGLAALPAALRRRRRPG